jgi:hypothetical protein
VRAIHPAQVELGREINPVVYSGQEFRRKLAAGDAICQATAGRAEADGVGGQG